MAKITIAIDTLSGDLGLSSTIPATIKAAQRYPNIEFILVGQQTAIDEFVKQHHCQLTTNITLHHASEIVTMHDSPRDALRIKKDSSMRVAINLVKNAQANAVISAGNTGALMATARFVLKMIRGISRPAIIVSFPTLLGKPVYMLDMGANVNCSAEQLLQFALMGKVAAQSIGNISQPTVNLLNIGEEEIKGNDIVKQAAVLIQQNPQINYQGYIEADKLFHGTADVIVCDGFVGNSVLKTAEGVVKMIGNIFQSEFRKSWLNKLKGLLARNVIKSAYKKIDPEIFSGSPLLGLNGIVIKSHGSSSSKAFYHAIIKGITAVEQQMPEKIKNGLQNLT